MKVLELLDQPIVHNDKLINPIWREIKKTRIGEVIKKPEELSIVMCHDYSYLTPFEKSLQFFGIYDYVVLNEPHDFKWWHMNKLQWIYNWIGRGYCNTDLILFSDSRDSILRGSLYKIVDFFNSLTECDLLFGSTSADNGLFQSIEHLKEQTDAITGVPGRYLNSGFFIGKTNYIVNVFKRAIDLVNASGVIERNAGYEQNERYDDQDILRQMFPVLYPRIDIDYYNQICYRS